LPIAKGHDRGCAQAKIYLRSGRLLATTRSRPRPDRPLWHQIAELQEHFLLGKKIGRVSLDMMEFPRPKKIKIPARAGISSEAGGIDF
jgi:hypothetical protein